MTMYRDCRAVVGSDDGEPDFEDDDVQVELAEGGIVVAYFDDQGPVVFQGIERSPGQFELKARSRPRTATLMRNGQRLEGRWNEAHAAGSLRIELGDPDG